MSILLIILIGGCQEAYQAGGVYQTGTGAAVNSPGFALEPVRGGARIHEDETVVIQGEGRESSPGRNHTAPDRADDDVANGSDERLLITKAEAVEKALASSLVLREMEVGSTAALERTRARDRLRNPEMRLNRRINLSGDPESGWEAGLRWRPPKAGELTAATDRNLADFGLIQADEKEFRRELISRVFECFSRLADLDRRIDYLGRKKELEARRLALLEKALKLEEATVLTVMKVELLVSRCEEQIAALDRERRREEKELQGLIGTARPIVPKPDPVGEENLTPENLLMIALETRPELRAAEYRKLRARAQLQLDRAEARPWPSFVEVSYNRRGEQDIDRLEFGLGISLPLFNNNGANIAASRLELTRAEMERLRAGAQIEGEILKAVWIYNSVAEEYRIHVDKSDQEQARIEKIMALAAYHELDPLEGMDIELLALERTETLNDLTRDLETAANGILLASGARSWSELIDIEGSGKQIEFKRPH